MTTLNELKALGGSDELVEALEKYRGQIDQYGNHSAAEALAKLGADKGEM